jgi:sulfur carrier protein ThiS
LNPRGASTSGFRDRRLGPDLATPAFKSLIKPFFIWVSIQVEITVKLSRTKVIKKINLKERSIVEDALKKINLKPDTVIVLNENKPISVDEELKDGQKFTILQVSSGG